MMDFYDVLAQVSALLQREGRTSYRALKRQFHLDDDYIEDLKEELIEARRLAVDENGRILVWTGRADVPSSPPPPASQHVTQAAPPGTALPQTAPPPAAPATLDAERRQLTVLFCDLVDSTRLANQLD